MRHLPTLKLVLGQLIFWGWNLLFLLFSFMLVPQLADFSMPWGFWFGFFSIAAMPFLSVALGVRNIRTPDWHFRWFYGVEGPLVFLSLLRIGTIREVTVPTGVWLSALAGMFLLYAAHIRRGLAKNTGIAAAQVLGMGATLFLSLGGVTLLSLFTIPITGSLLEAIGELISAFFSFRWLEFREAGNLVYLPLVLVYLTLFVASASLFVAMPYAAITLYLTTWLRIFRESWGRMGAWPTTALTGLGVVGTWLVLAGVDKVQPHEKVLDLVRSEPQTAEVRKQLLADREGLRAGLVDAALSSYRYWGSSAESNEIESLWREELFGRRTWDPDNRPTDDAAAYAEALFQKLCSPLVYRGENLRADQELARERYQLLFDQPFDKAERKAIHDALDATWSRDEAKAGIADIDQKRVHLEDQTLSWKLSGDIAEVQLDESYRNVTALVQEIQVSFSLPENAVLTGVWLSDDPNNRTMYGPILAPRGAAQAVYERLRQRGTDPALLEEVGPRQYRLRVFPIPGIGEITKRGEEARNKPVYLRMTWTTLLDAQGIPVPQLLETRNLFWDQDSKRSIENTPATFDGWLPARVGPVASVQTHHAQLPDGTLIEAVPLTEQPPLPTGKHFAVLVDSSLSMEPHAAQLTEQLSWIQHNLAADNRIDAFTASGWGGPGIQSLDLKRPEVSFFGQLHIQDAFSQLNTVASESYDAIFYLTDDGTYDNAKDAPFPSQSGKLWLIHLGGKLPIGYPDAVGDLLLGGGGVATSMAEAVARLGTEGGDIVDGYIWKKLDPAISVNIPSEAAFAPLAARRYLAWVARDQKTLSLEQLDQAHQFAKTYGMVSPWSSLLVLVSDWQKDLLKTEEAKTDRFERETDNGNQFLSSPHSPLVSSVPEPETWLLLGIVGLGLVWVHKRQRAMAAA